MAIRPPPFMETAVSGWFAILDAQFHLANISSNDTKFFHVLSSLPADVVARVDPSVIAAHDFSSLKSAVVEMFERTKPELFEKLISKTVMTGRPSEFLSELRELASKVGVGDELIRHKFIQSLPAAMATVLAAQRDLTLVQMGKLADELVPLVNSPAVVAAHSVSFRRTPRETSPARRSNSPAPGVRSQLETEPFHEGQLPKVCRAHLYYGPAARSCRSWCAWPNKSRGMIRSRDPTPAPQRRDEENRPGRL